jgi:hypothetical protein
MFQATPNPGGGRFARRIFAAAFLLMPALLLEIFVPPAVAQYPGRIQPDDQKKPDEPRAVSILEWVGDPGKPVASRIVPLSVFVHGEYQDGGLFMAQPAPLTVESDTLYELEQAGVAKGTFYVAGGEEVAGAWFGYGKWKPLAPPAPPKKLAPSKILPKVVEDNDPDRPHLKNSSPRDSGAGGSAASADDPDKPTLHRAPGSGGGQGTTTASSSSGSSASSDASADDPDKPTLHRRDADSAQSASGAATAPDDPDRPHLRKQSAAAAAAESGDGPAVTSANESDPDRPKLSRGKPAAAEVPLQATKLAGLPPDLQQMAAVSDAVSREEHSFAYPWPDPSEAAKMQSAVEQLAIQAALTGGFTPAERIGPPPAAAKPVKATAVQTKSRAAARKVPPRSPQVALSDEDFHAYELSYNGGATLVLTAKATIAPDASGAAQSGTPAEKGTPEEKYVTIIAQPDFNGDPQLRLESVTDAKHLDITPRMKLIDAVDANGDSRAELIFELMRASDRQFAIYVIRGGQAEQAFATESLPYVTPAHAVETSSR